MSLREGKWDTENVSEAQEREREQTLKEMVLCREPLSFALSLLGANESSRHSPALGPQRHKPGSESSARCVQTAARFGLRGLCTEKHSSGGACRGEGCKLDKEHLPRAQGHCLHGKRMPRSYKWKNFTLTGLL